MLYAFFDRDERLDMAAMRRQVDALIRRGVHGLSVLGLASEVNKMNVMERRALLDCVADAVNGRVPLSVTIGEPSVPGQIEFVRAAKAAGASWAILQTPPVRGASETALLRFFGGVADKTDLPLGLQIAPAYLGLDMSAASLRVLRRQHRNVALLKIESDPLTTARLIEDTDGAFVVFNGRAGLEMTHNLDAGCAGIIPGAECADRLARLYELYRSAKPRDKTAAESQYRAIAPLLTFLETSLDNLLVYGKRILARRLDLSVERAQPRQPFTPPHPFGLAMSERLARQLGRL
jgi:4-hydroxy-tetrahydrodipicolinate synthase